MICESTTEAGRRLFAIVLVAVAIIITFSTPVFAQTNRLICDVQGPGDTSPYVKEFARVNGIVTARVKNGFFIQMPDEKSDKNPATSDGIFVFTGTEPDENAAVGNMVSVPGTIEEFGPRTAPFALSVTEISMQKGRDIVQVLSKNNPLPKPIILSPADFLPKTIDQLERYEGMRVQAMDLTAVSPTGGRVNINSATSESNGVFFAVLSGTSRPFREPGLDYYDYVFLTEKERTELIKTYPKLLLFDDNPERIRIESMAQTGSKAIDVSTYAEIKALSGVLHYSNRSYSILVDPDSKPVVTNTMKVSVLPSPKSNEFLVAGMNLENFFDDVDDPGTTDDVLSTEGLQKRMKKISIAVRMHLQLPDVIGTVEVENLAVLKRLVQKINADTVAGGMADPKYEAYLVEGNDQRGIDVGFLVKSSRIKVIETKQFGKDEKYKNPVKNEDAFLNDRPPLMLRASIEDPKTKAPVEFTVIVNHLKSFNGYNDPKIQDDVRLKKRLQSEFLAKLVNERQKAHPDECIVLVGDFNSYQFGDGITDLIGTIKGKPTPINAILNPSEDLVERDLIDFVDLINIEQRYSYSFDGNAQVLDHIIINEAMKRHISGFAYPRLNADFPETDRGDAAKVQRFSDHDPAVAYFTIEDTAKK